MEDLLAAGSSICGMVRPERLELPTLCSEGRCSIHLSYGRARKHSTANWAGAKAHIFFFARLRGAEGRSSTSLPAIDDPGG